MVNGVPLERALNLNVDVLDGPEKFEDELTDWRYASPDYFTVLRAPIVAGRGFTEADRAGAPPVAVVSEQFARRFFKGSSPLGRHIRVFDADGSIEIVGVVRDLKEGGLRWRPLPVMYVPVAQAQAVAIRTTHRYFHASWVVRADAPGAALRRQIEEELRAVAPGLPIALFRTMDESKMRALAEERFQLTLLSAFAGVGLILASAGIYGLIAYSVAERTRELGIRIALGASRQRILRSILGQGLRLAVSGVIIGAAIAAFAARVLRNFVWGVTTGDPADVRRGGAAAGDRCRAREPDSSRAGGPGQPGAGAEGVGIANSVEHRQDCHSRFAIRLDRRTLAGNSGNVATVGNVGNSGNVGNAHYELACYARPRSVPRSARVKRSVSSGDAPLAASASRSWASVIRPRKRQSHRTSSTEMLAATSAVRWPT